MTGLLVSEIAAQTASPQPTLSVGGMGAGVGKFRDNQWGLVHLTVRNPSDQTRHLLGVIAVDRLPDMQYARPMILPPQAVRRTWAPLRAPDTDPRDPDSRSVGATGRLIDASGSGGETLLGQEPALLLHETRAVSTAMMISDSTDSRAGDESADAAVAAQIAAEVGKSVSVLRPSALPPVAAGYEALDTLLIARDLSDMGAAESAALRAWIIAGGRVWIMLDRTPVGDVQSLLGASWKPQIVDRVNLTDFTIEGTPEPLTISVERPIEMVRLLAPGMEVIHKVNGWPASLRMPMGQGQMLVTTLGARAWVQADKTATVPLVELGKIHFTTPKPMIAAIDWQPFLGEHIGYEVVTRETVAVILALFCVALLLGGMVLHRKGRLEHIGWVAVVLAIVTAVSLVAIGTISQGQTPQTVVSAQTLELVVGQRQAVMRGAMQLYQPPGGVSPEADRLGSTTGGAAWPQTDKTGGKLLRMVWSDLDRWHWDNLQLPQGVTTGVEFATTSLLPTEAQGQLSFDAQGIRGHVRVGNDPLHEAVLIGPSGILLPRIAADGVFTATDEDVPDPGQYIVGAGLASEEQRRREKLYVQLLGSGGDKPSIRALRTTQPLMLGWTAEVGSGIGLSDAARRIDQSLVVLPLPIQRPKAGTTVTIPSAFVTFTIPRASRSDREDESDGNRAGNRNPARTQRSPARLTTVYDASRGEWIAVSQGGSLVIRFDPPAALLPLKVSSAKLLLDIRAPQRTVALVSKPTGSPNTGATIPANVVQSPSGLLTFDVADQTGLLLTKDQGIEVTIDVSEVDAAQVGQPWQIRSIGLTVTGVIEPAQ